MRAHLRMIRLIGVIVPRRLRADWRQEWEAELRYREELLAEWDRLDARSRLDLLARSLGAFWDALVLQPRRLEDDMFQDLRFGARMLLKQPGFTLVALLTLALGIGANTAIFNIINAVLLKPLSGREPERLIGLYSRDTTRADSYRLFSYPNYIDLRAERDVFEDVLATANFSAGVAEGETTQQVAAVRISSNYFSVFGVEPFQGRAFLEREESEPSSVAIVSHGWWQRHGSPPDLVGRSIRVNGSPAVIVGIAPRGFTGPIAVFTPDLFVPLSFPQPGSNIASMVEDRNRHELMLVGRLKEGVTMEEANARLALHSARMAEAYPAANRDQLVSVAQLPRMGISSAPRNDRAQIGAMSAVVLGLTSLVLLIACLNLANMLLARGAARRRELAVRMALGARPGRILRQLLTEGFLLSALGGALGLAIAVYATNWLGSSLSQSVPFYLDTRFDARVLGAAFGFSLLSTIFFALGPALKSVRLDLNTTLKEGSGAAASAPRKGKLRYLLVVGQAAFSLCLLVAAGLLGRGAIQAISIEPGFDLDRTLYLQLDSSLAGYDEARVRALYDLVTERARALPGVEAASIAMTPPFGLFTFGQRVQQAGAPYPPPSDAATPAQGKYIPSHYNVIGSDFFRALGIPLLAGREFHPAPSTVEGTPREVIISSTLAERLWPGEEALGRRVQLSGGSDADDPGVGAFVPAGGKPKESFEVVGIVAPFRDQLLPEGDHPLVFVPFGRDYRPAMSLIVRATAGASVEALLREVREEVRRVDPQLPVLAMKPLRNHLETSVSVLLMRTSALLFAGFGALALSLSLVGVYGVNSYLAAQRRREIGIRMALGANRRAILLMFMREGMVLTGISLGAGLMLAALVARLMRGMLFEVSPFDPLVFGAASALLAVTAMVACWLPARKATKVDPLEALRYE